MDRQAGVGGHARACLRLLGRVSASENRNGVVGRRAALRLAFGTAAFAGATLLTGCGDSKSAFEDYSFPRTSSESGRYLSDEEHARLRQQWQAQQDAKAAQATAQPAGGS
jgi:hypothetical protein